MNKQDTLLTVDEILGLFDEAAALIRSLGDRELNTYCLAALEGHENGWVGGKFERDYLENYRTAMEEEAEIEAADELFADESNFNFSDEDINERLMKAIMGDEK